MRGQRRVLRVFLFQDTESLTWIRRLLGLRVFGLGWPLWTGLGRHNGR